MEFKRELKHPTNAKSEGTVEWIPLLLWTVDDRKRDGEFLVKIFTYLPDRESSLTIFWVAGNDIAGTFAHVYVNRH